MSAIFSFNKIIGSKSTYFFKFNIFSRCNCDYFNYSSAIDIILILFSLVNASAEKFYSKLTTICVNLLTFFFFHNLIILLDSIFELTTISLSFNKFV